MTDRDRLINLIINAKREDPETGSFTEFLADYLIAGGAILPPCKVGDIVYTKYSGTNEIEYYVVDEVIHLGSDNFEFKAHLENEDGYVVDNIDFGVPEIGKTVFLTCEEAEKVLKRSKDNA